jgi:hypothetical protein
MCPSHAAKAGRRWRYYLSRALLKGRKSDAGLVTRVPAARIEKQVLDATKSVIPTRRSSEGLVTLSHVALSGKTAGSHPTVSKPCPGLCGHEDVLDAVDESQSVQRRSRSSSAMPWVFDGQDRTLTVPWISPSTIPTPRDCPSEDDRTLRPAQCGFERAGRIVAREYKSERSIRMTLSLSFVAPPIVAAAKEGRLPRGFGVKRADRPTDRMVPNNEKVMRLTLALSRLEEEPLVLRQFRQMDWPASMRPRPKTQDKQRIAGSVRRPGPDPTDSRELGSPRHGRNEVERR